MPTLTKALMTELRLPGEATAAFAAELKKLDDADKARFVQLFTEAGITIDTAPQA